jgi:hypothetical protein
MATPIQQGLEVASRLVGEVAGLGPDRLGIMGQHARIERVGLGVLADRAGEVADPTRLDDPDRDRGVKEVDRT